MYVCMQGKVYTYIFGTMSGSEGLVFFSEVKVDD